jgi:predicted DNA-binding transcriptional regulator YafY
MASSKDQLHRQWTLLQKIPIRPSGKTATQLMDELAADGYMVSKRMIERDLVDLKNSPFGVSCDEKAAGNNPNRWFFERDAKLHLLPAMSMQMAFTLLFAERILKYQLPPSVLNPIQQVLVKAASTLKSSKSTYRNWHRYVKHDSRTMPLIPANIDHGVLEDCLEGILNGFKLSVTYKPRFDELKKYEVNPLGIVFRDSVAYLVCTIWKYADIRQLALHRIQKIEILPDQKSVIPKGFNLDTYISDEGAFQYTESPGKRIKVTLKFDRFAAQHLEETPLSQDQSIKKDGDYTIVQATSFDSSQLRWWLLSFGDNVEVMKPKSLRDEFATIARNMLSSYS